MRTIPLISFILLITVCCEREATAPPTAIFRVNRLNPEVNEVISFTNRSRQAEYYEWDFGDGQTSFDKNPEHYYTSEGEYTVRLTVGNTLGTDDTNRVFMITHPDILWPAPGGYHGITAEEGTIDFTVSSKNIPEFKGSFFVNIAGENFELNSSFEFGRVYRTDTGFVATHQNNRLTGNFINDSITGIWKHDYGSVDYRVIRQ